jgi:hypothetical protein
MSGAAPSEWPALLGQPLTAALQTLTASDVSLTVVAVEAGSMCTADYRTDRVRVFHRGGLVVEVPRRG